MQVCFAQTVDSQALGPRGCSAYDFDVCQSQTEAQGEETAQCLVRLTFDGRSSQTHEKHAVTPAGYLVSRRARCYAYVEEGLIRHSRIVNG